VKVFLNLLLIVALWTSQAKAEEYQITEHKPDAQARKVIASLIKSKELEPEHSDYSTEGYSARWIKLTDDGPAYLFVIHDCGSGGCIIRGFGKRPDGWEKIFEAFGGEAVQVLDSQTDGHLDIQILDGGEFKSGGPMFEKTYKWSDDWYGTCVTKRIFPAKD
jgi:hypothetical protein